MSCAFADVEIDRRVVSEALMSLGVDLSQPLAPAIVLGATDVLIALELAQELPAAANYTAVLGQLQSFGAHEMGSVMQPVREAQLRLLDAALKEPACAGIHPDRLNQLRGLLPKPV
ncbi:hypothetical protein [Ramlibacter sp. AN1133]|uniref:hypothetical protein n=1 Tax=Ramlibacter sp. AN1133 TaxID=3133429 RepID=UPI0030C19568